MLKRAIIFFSLLIIADVYTSVPLSIPQSVIDEIFGKNNLDMGPTDTSVALESNFTGEEDVNE